MSKSIGQTPKLNPVPNAGPDPIRIPVTPEVGLVGQCDKGNGVLAQSNTASGIMATSRDAQAVTAFSDNDIGIFSQGASWAGVFNGALVVSKGPNPKNANIPPNAINGSIVINDGNLYLNKGDIFLTGADCAEEFDTPVGVDVEAGTVMIIDGNGTLCPSFEAYDKKVAGVVSGAGNYKTGIVLDKQVQTTGEKKRSSIALIGKVFCKADAGYGAIEVGDLLTTSSTPGHAMKVTDPLKAFGTVIGKALHSLKEGKGLVPILIALH